MAEPNEKLLEELALTAQRYLGLKEEGTNRGKFVDNLNKNVRAPLGSPWCAAFACGCVAEIIEEHENLHTTFTPSAHVRTLVRNNQELLIANPIVGAIVCWGYRDSPSGHCGIIVDVAADMSHFTTVEGNTDDKETIEREGGCVAQNKRENKDVGKFQLLGFIKPF